MIIDLFRSFMLHVQRLVVTFCTFHQISVTTLFVNVSKMPLKSRHDEGQIKKSQKKMEAWKVVMFAIRPFSLLRICTYSGWIAWFRKCWGGLLKAWGHTIYSTCHRNCSGVRASQVACQQCDYNDKARGLSCRPIISFSLSFNRQGEGRGAGGINSSWTAMEARAYHTPGSNMK